MTKWGSLRKSSLKEGENVYRSTGWGGFQTVLLFSHSLQPRGVAHQASLSFTNSQSLLKVMSIKLLMPFGHLVLFCPLLLLPSIFPSIRVFSSELAHCIKFGQSIRASALVLPMNRNGWFPLGLTGLISLQSRGLSRVFSNTTVQKHQFFSVQPLLWSNSYIHTWQLEKP